jgi:hypothetical protein
VGEALRFVPRKDGARPSIVLITHELRKLISHQQSFPATLPCLGLPLATCGCTFWAPCPVLWPAFAFAQDAGLQGDSAERQPSTGLRQLRWSGWTYPSNALVRSRVRPAKHPVATEECSAAVRGAFAIRRGGRVDNLQILLLDDVMTTGATLDACTRSMRSRRQVSSAAYDCPDGTSIGLLRHKPVALRDGK